MFKTALIPCIALSISGTSSAAQALVISYPDALVDVNPNSFEVSASKLLGGPFDGSIQFFNSQATYKEFNSSVNYDLNTFASLIGVSPTVLERGDFIAFDAGGNLGLFEQSLWIFEDADSTLAYQHEVFGSTGELILFEGGISIEAYNDFFGASLPDVGGVSILLFDLSSYGIETRNEEFAATLQAEGSSCATLCPDVPLLATFDSKKVPEPLGLIGMTAFGSVLALRKMRFVKSLNSKDQL
jgi:hypothetical protein